MIYNTRYVSKLGELLLLSDGKALTGLCFSELPPENAVQQEDLPVFLQAKNWLNRYFDGEKPEVDFAISPKGTAFQKQVWRLLLEIPFGQTRSYGDIARELGCGSAQAVGQAVGANPIAIFIPCHRIIGAKGQLTGYAWGLEKKKWLLQHEGIL